MNQGRSERVKTVGLILGVVILLGISVSQAKDFKFPEIAGWKQSEEIQTFIPKTLYEYINGAADLYFTYDFQDLTVAEHQNEKKVTVVIEIYRFGSPTHAFGIYSQERLSDANFLDMGAQGYNDKDFLNFVAGSYYVKMNAIKLEPENQDVLILIAKKVAEHLGQKGTLPSILHAFPEEGKVKNSEKFIAKNFLGYSFFHSAFTAEYDLGVAKFKLFVIETGDQNECRKMMQKYFGQTGRTEKGVEEGRHTLSDPYHGEMDLHWKGGHIWGILSLNNPTLRSEYLKLLEEGLEKRK